MSSSFLHTLARWITYGILLLTPFVYLERSLYPYISIKTAFFFGGVELLFGVFVALCLLERRFLPEKKPVLLAVCAFFIVLLGTSLLGIDPARSILSTEERATGVFFFLHLFVFLVMLVSLLRERIVSSRTMLWTIAGSATLVSFLGLLQFKNPNLLLNEPIGSRPGSTFGNPTFLAGYLLFSFFFTLFLAARSREKERGIALFLALVQIVMLFGTQTRGDILGLFGGIVALLLCLLLSPPQGWGIWSRKRTYGLILGALILFGGIFWGTRTVSLWSHIPGLSRFTDISFHSDVVNPRLTAWRIAWQGFLEKPLLGWGWENFNVVFNAHYDPRLLEAGYGETRFDKPHNVYLEYLVSGGIPLFASYLALLFFVFRLILRFPDRTARPLFLAALVGYLIRSFFVFDTLGPLLLLAVLVALLHGERLDAPSPSSRLLPWGAYASMGAGILLAYFVSVRTVIAFGHQHDGYRLTANGKTEEGIAAFAEARSVWTPYTNDFARDYALVITELYFYNPDRVSPEAAIAALQAMEYLAATHPQDAYYHYALIDLYNQLYALSPEEYAARALREGEIALRLSPGRQQVYFSLAKTRQLQKDFDGALALIQQGIDETPTLPDGHFYYGLIAFAKGDGVAGYREVQRALSLGKVWKNYYEPRATANYFSDYGHFAEAIPLYRAALSMGVADPLDIADLKTKLAVSLYASGNREESRAILLDISESFDLTTSPLYDSLLPILRDLGISP